MVPKVIYVIKGEFKIFYHVQNTIFKIIPKPHGYINVYPGDAMGYFFTSFFSLFCATDYIL